MKKEYLPIGSVCTLYSNDIKVMITGYFAIEYESNIKVFMYNAVPYPKGTSASKNRYSFNDGDIKKVEFEGLKNDEYEKFNKKLADINIGKIESAFNELNMLKKTMDFEFDENGFVIADNREEANATDNPFNSYKKSTPVETAEPEDVSDWSIFKKYKFDDKGTVIGVEEVPQSKENGSSETPKYEFDENGVVVGVAEEAKKPDEKDSSPATQKYEFDENGVVVGVNEEDPQSKDNSSTTSKYKFDENGVVVGVDENNS